MLEFRVLGSLELRHGRDGRSIGSVVAQPKRLALLAYLVLASPRGPHQRGALLGMFWPESPEEQGRHALRQALYQLRQSLGETAFAARGDGEVGIDPAVVRCDALDFEDALGRGDPLAALELYGGELLPGFAIDGCPGFEDWIERRRDELRRRAVDAALALPAEAAPRWLDAAAGWAPYDERVVRRQIEVLHAAGRTGEALRAYEAFAARFRRELELDPSPETQALVEAIRTAPAPPEPEPSGVGHVPVDPVAASAGAVGASGPVVGSGAPPVTPPGSRALPVAGLVLATILFGALVVATRGPGPLAEPPPSALPASRVLVMDFRELTNGGEDALAASMATDWIAQGLLRTGMLEVVSGGIRLGDHERAGAGLAALAASAGAGSIVDGTVYRQDGALVFQVRIADETGALRRAIEYRAPEGETVVDSVERLRQRVMGALAAMVDPRLSSWAAVAGAPPSFEAYRHYIEGIERFTGVAVGVAPVPIEAIREAAASFRRAFELDTTFAAALVWAVLAHQDGGPPGAAAELLPILQARRDTLPPWERHMTDFLLARQDRDWEGGYRAIIRVNDLTPGGDWAYHLAVAALWTGRPRTTIEALDRIDPEHAWQVRDWPLYCGYLLPALHTIGEHERELAEVHRCRRLYPDYHVLTTYEVDALAALGRGDDAAAVAARSLAELTSPALRIQGIASDIIHLEAHGHHDQARWLADRSIEWYERELTAGERAGIRPVFQGQLFYATGRYEAARELLRGTPEDELSAGELGMLALAEARLGHRDEALRLWDRLEAMDPDQVNSQQRALFRVRLAGLLLEPDRTVRTLAEGWDSGELQRVIGWAMHASELQHLRDHPGFRALVRPRD